MSRALKIALISPLVILAVLAKDPELFSVLKSTALIGKQADGSYLLVTNQSIRPWGEQALISGRPVDLAMDSGKRLLALLNTRAVLLRHASTGVQVAEVKTRSTSYAGVAFRPGDRELWASETSRNGPDSILIAELSETGLPGKTARIELPGHPVPVGIAFSADGQTAYVAFSRNNSVAVIDAAKRTVQQEIPVGLAPFAVKLAARQGKLFVSNRGGRRPAAGDTLVPTSGSEVVGDPKTGAAVSGTVSVIDLKTRAVREVTVGLAPSGMALSPDEKLLAVANGNSDSISLIRTDTLGKTDVPAPTFPEGAFGSMPIGAEFTPDAKTIYVPCGGINAIAVLREAGGKWAVGGALPTAWFPSAVAVDSQGDLSVVTIKGLGNTADKKGTFNSREYEGSLMKIPAPSPAQLAAGVRELRAANSPRFEPAGGVASLASLGIQHVFLIIKENRTYDQVFGDMGKGNSDPKLVMYGSTVSPNHHALAGQFVLLDNFYCSSAISFDGHQWLTQAFVSDYVERAFAASPRGYAWDLSDSLVISPKGFFWQFAPNPASQATPAPFTPVNVRIYGEFGNPGRRDPDTGEWVRLENKRLLKWNEYLRLHKEGKWRESIGTYMTVPAMRPFAFLDYPAPSTLVPDQLRADAFLADFAELDKKGRVPHISVMALTSDHTVGTNPGAPSPRAMVADNDLALGRIVEAISHSKVWPRSLILVVEDDPQNGVDHVDGHRTVALAIGPYIRRGAVDSNNYNQVSMIRSIQEIFRIPSRTRFLAAARAMNSTFTAKPDLTPYQCLPNQIPLDQMNPPEQALNGRRLWAARQSRAINWYDIDDVPQETLNQILWWDARGYDKPYPKPK